LVVLNRGSQHQVFHADTFFDAIQSFLLMLDQQ